MSQDHERRIQRLEQRADADGGVGCAVTLAVIVLIVVDMWFGGYMLEAVLSPWLGPMPR